MPRADTHAITASQRSTVVNPEGDLMRTIPFDYIVNSAAIDILALLAISIGIFAEMHRGP
jgi:hypothetical protein